MKLSYFMTLSLRSISGGTDATINVSTHGGLRKIGSTNTFFAPLLHMRSALTSEFGRAKDPYQVPATLAVLIDNPDGRFNAYLPNGDSPQFWDRASVTVYEGDATLSGANVTTMTVAFQGKVRLGSVRYPAGCPFIEFAIDDIRAESNKPVCTETWSQHTDYDSAVANVVNGAETIPVILGDWTGTAQRIPAKLLDVAGSVYTYGVCNHACGTLVVYDEDGNVLTPTSTANFATRGSFQMTGGSGSYVAAEDVWVTCVGYPSDLSDKNHARLIQFILTQFGKVSAADEIYNRLADANNNERGSFRQLYEQSGGTNPQYSTRLYVTDKTVKALNLAASVAYECNAWITVVDGRYRLYWQMPIAATGVIAVGEQFIDKSDTVNISSDPKQEFHTVMRAEYGYDPANGDYLGNWDSSVEVTSGPIETARDEFRSDTTQTITDADIVFDDKYNALYQEADVNVACQRRMFWATRLPQYADATLLAVAQNDERFSLQLFNDIDLQHGHAAGNYFRVYSLRKDCDTGRLTVQGLLLKGLGAAGVWVDDDGLDAVGNLVANSFWCNAAGTNGAGLAAESRWV